MKLTKHEIEDLIERIQQGEAIPEDYKYKLFPVKQKEYELVYGGKMRREDVLANEDGVFPVPLQIEKIYNGTRETWKGGWKNIISFGDNLQFLKTIYEDKNPLIKGKIKGKVKVIYIDPPFATEAEYKTTSGNKAYTDKSKGADFVEFIRRRLIVAREILADDGSIFVHLDWKKVHYVKAVLDEVFNENFFVNEIVWHYADNFQGNVKGFATNHNTILWYSKTGTYTSNKVMIPLAKTTKRDKRVWSGELKKLVSARDEEGNLIYEDFSEKKADDVWEIGQSSTTKKASSEFIDYPTQKPEELLKRVILAASNEGEIVMDFFGGSGTTIAAAEKLNRRWISCDIGKLAFYTMQKRMLNIETSKSLFDAKKLYSKPAKSFVTLNTGHYDLEKVFKLQQDEYCDFVMNLFEVEPKKKTISGIQIDGEKKDGYNVIVWPYWKFKDSLVDDDFLHDLHSHIGSKAGKRVYIIAPANFVDFISDYYEIDKVRYYFLKVPYHIIRELHKVQFKKFRQPQSKSNVNDLEDAIGFHFMRQPEVKSELKEKGGEYTITIKKFLSDFSEEETGQDMLNFESLAMVLVDRDFDGDTFEMDEYFFAEDLLPKKKKKSDEDDTAEIIKEELKNITQIQLPPFAKKECGKSMMVIYVDVYGNEFKEYFKLK